MKSAQSYFTIKKDYVSTLNLTNEETQFPAKIFSQVFYKKLVAEGIPLPSKEPKALEKLYLENEDRD